MVLKIGFLKLKCKGFWKFKYTWKIFDGNFQKDKYLVIFVDKINKLYYFLILTWIDLEQNIDPNYLRIFFLKKMFSLFLKDFFGNLIQITCLGFL